MSAPGDTNGLSAARTVQEAAEDTDDDVGRFRSCWRRHGTTRRGR